MENTNFSQASSFDDQRPHRVAVLGASGYGGLQSIRLLAQHPKFKITFLGGDRSAGRNWNEICKFIPLDSDLRIQEINPSKIADEADFVILSLPNGVSSELTPQLLEYNLRVVDLSADYRYNNLITWNKIYVQDSTKFVRNDQLLCNEAVYGLAEWNAKEIANARLVAAPGCFPTASLLPLGVSLLISPTLMFQVLVLRLALQNIEAFLLTPLLLRRTVNLLPTVALTSQLSLGALLGLPGILFALPLAVVLQVCMQHLIVYKILDKWT